MEEFRQLEHGYVISPLSTLSTGRIPQEIARVSPAISQAKSRVAAKHSARRIRTPSVEMSAAILNISICGGDKVVRASFRVFCATMMAVAFCSMAAAETLVLEIADARVARDQRTGRPIVDVRLAPSSTQPFAAFATAHVGNKFELRVDGRLVAAPVVREPITSGAVQIDLGAPAEETLNAIAEQLRKPGARVEVSGE